MSNVYPPAEKQAIATQNERSLQRLAEIIEASQGEFKLILARCNYRDLQDELVAQLLARLPGGIPPSGVIRLKETDVVLYETIRSQLSTRLWGSIQLLGLEQVHHLERSLVALNQVREEFGKNLPYPLVLWLTDMGHHKFMRFAPDFESFAISIDFTMPVEILLQSLRNGADQLFSDALWSGGYRFVDNATLDLHPGSYQRQELEAALQDLEKAGMLLDDELTASWQFLMGRDEAAQSSLNDAFQHFQQSLDYWQQHQNLERQGCLLFHLGLCWRQQAALKQVEDSLGYSKARNYFQQAIATFAQAHRPDLQVAFMPALADMFRKLGQWDELETLCNTAIQLQQDHPDRVSLAFYYGMLANVYLEQGHPESARGAATIALNRVGIAPGVLTPQPIQPADKVQADHLHWAWEHHVGLYLWLLARAEQNLENPEAAIQALEHARALKGDRYDPQLYINILNDLRDRYFEQGQYLQAFEIKQERRSIQQQYGLRAFVGAGWLQPQRQVAQRSIRPGTRPSPGEVATEIVASGRQHDIDQLMRRIDDNDYKLIVLHGYSGVGKSSLLYAGLIPTLKQHSFRASDYLPIAVRVYRKWACEVAKALKAELADKGFSNGRLEAIDDTAELEQIIPAILEQLQQNDDLYKLRTVLIFDQFEEFFFEKAHADFQKRLLFFNFLNDCLNLPSVKVILSLRRDYLHRLLQINDFLGQMDGDPKSLGRRLLSDILGQQVLYPVGNLSLDDARTLLQQLTERSGEPLDRELINTLAEDLKDRFAKVRPIELQIVGTQLQADDITSLEQYRALGANPKEVLVERFLEQVIEDCGPPNREATNSILSFLTDEKGTRPLTTKAELREKLSSIPAELTATDQQLDLILNILVKSSLVLLLQEAPANRYQLVHDYLAALIAQKRRSSLEKRIAQLEEEKKEAEEKQQEEERKRREAEEKQQEEERKRREAEESRQKAEERSKRLNLQRCLLVSLAIVALGAAGFAVKETIQGRIEKIRANVSESKALSPWSPKDSLRALMTAVQAGREIEAPFGVEFIPRKLVPFELEVKAATTMQQLAYSLKELTRLTDTHHSPIADIRFSDHGQLLVSVDETGKIGFWHWGDDPPRTATLPLPDDGDGYVVTSMDFDPASQIMVTGGRQDRFGAIKLWQYTENADPIQALDTLTLKEPYSGVNAVSVDPTDSSRIAFASDDRTVRVWNRQSNDPTVFTDPALIGKSAGKSHTDRVKAIAFSPDGQILASASWDGTIKLWNQDGILLNTLNWLDPELITDTSTSKQISTLQFSPDGEFLAAGGVDGTIRIWRVDGQRVARVAIRTKHEDRIQSLSFSPDSPTLASASVDNTVWLWDLARLEEPERPDQSRLLPGTSNVTRVQFSPDGTLATASQDGSISLWQTQEPDYRLELPSVENFSIPNADFSENFSENGGILATVEQEKSQTWIILWGSDGKKKHRFLTADYGSQIVEMSPNGQYLANVSTGYKPNTQGEMAKTSRISVRDTSLQTLWNPPDFSTHWGEVTALRFDPKTDLLAIAETAETAEGNRHTVTLWSLADQKVVQRLEGGTAAVQSLDFSPDGQWLALGSADNTIRLWRWRGNQWQAWKTISTDAVAHLRFSPDSQKLAAASNKPAPISIWNLDQMDQSPIRLEDPASSALTVAAIGFSHQGRILVSASTDGIVRLWTVKDGTFLAPFDKESSASILSLGIDDKQQKIYTIDADHNLNVWDLNLHTVLQDSCNQLRHYLLSNPQDEELDPISDDCGIEDVEPYAR